MSAPARSLFSRAFSAAGVGALLLVGFGATPVSSLLARAWAVAGSPRKADVIVVLGGGVVWPEQLTCGGLQRVEHGVWLYHRSFAPHLILSGGANSGYASVPADAEVMRRTAVLMGVEPEDIVVEDRASRTYDNGREVAAIMRERGWRSALLVTDALHMRRARLVFARLGVEAYAAPSFTPGVVYTTPGEGLAVLERTGFEVVATLIYRLRNWA